jgi:hypothetical protein
VSAAAQLPARYFRGTLSDDIPEATVDLVDKLEAVLVTQYTIDRRIGRSGMATVFLARNARHRHLVRKDDAAAMCHPWMVAGDLCCTPSAHKNAR